MKCFCVGGEYSDAHLVGCVERALGVRAVLVRLAGVEQLVEVHVIHVRAHPAPPAAAAAAAAPRDVHGYLGLEGREWTRSVVAPLSPSRADAEPARDLTKPAQYLRQLSSTGDATQAR